jgi:hypothetical protein
MSICSEERNINAEKCYNEVVCCCMPCIGICKGMFLWVFWIGMCGCINYKRTPTVRDVSPVVTHSEINEVVDDVEEIEFVDFSEECKDATRV